VEVFITREPAKASWFEKAIDLKTKNVQYHGWIKRKRKQPGQPGRGAGFIL
jgi:hypothetical protein